MTFTGTLVTDLQALVDRHLNRVCICGVCGRHYKEHSVVGAHCSNSTTPPGCKTDADIFGVPGCLGPD